MRRREFVRLIGATATVMPAAALYGVDVPELFRRAANYVDRILKGTSPGDLPVQLPDKFEFVINQKTQRLSIFKFRPACSPSPTR